jgi:BirA family transcriptional regulator, biotin operon repressor / biotin---[acetyl-CoA-carboxylase] ligase
MFGAPHRHFRRTDSTNTRARELAEDGAPGGTVVTAEEQTAGRGRQGRAWTAPAGKALLYSAILRPFGDRPLLPLAAALAACDAAEDLAPGVGCRIKWPNDVWVEERKLAGILIETKVQENWAVIGVGLNLSIAPEELPPDLRDTAVSLFGSTTGGRGEPHRSLPAVAPAGLPPTPLTSAAVLSRHLDRWVETEPQTVLAAYRERDALRGREIGWSAGPELSPGADGASGSGVAVGIDDRGGLVVLLPGGGRTVLFAGEVHLRL